MAEALIARTPLGGDSGAGLRTHGDSTIVMLREMPAAAMIDLRLDPADAAALDAACSALSLALPLTPGKSSAAGGRVAIWCGPDQWLIVAPPAHAAPLMLALRWLRRFGGRCQRSARRVRTGGAARNGCAAQGLRDRSASARVRAGRLRADCICARARIVLRQTDERPAYRIFVERSVAAYLWDWLVDAMREYCGA